MHSHPTFLHVLVETELTVAFSLFPVRLARGHAARSLPGRCEHLQRDHGISPMLPMSLIESVGHYNAKSEALRGCSNCAATGPSSRRASRPFFLPYRVRLIALVTVVVFFLFGVARNMIPVSSEQLTSSAAMAPPRLAPAQGSFPPPFSLGRPICFQQLRLHTPSGLCNWSTVDHGRGPRALDQPVHAHRGGPSQSQRATWPPYRPATRSAADRRVFLDINPPVSSKSTRSPT